MKDACVRRSVHLKGKISVLRSGCVRWEDMGFITVLYFLYGRGMGSQKFVILLTTDTAYEESDMM